MKLYHKIDIANGTPYIGQITKDELPDITHNHDFAHVTELIQDNTYYSTGTIVERAFPENSNLIIGKKYLMNWCLNITTGGIWNNDMGNCYLYITDENNNDIMLSAWPLNAMLWNTFGGCGDTNPCMNLQTSWGAFFAGSKIVQAVDVGGVGKVILKFEIHHGHLQWRIYDDMKDSYIEFIEIDNN